MAIPFILCKNSAVQANYLNISLLCKDIIMQTIAELRMQIYTNKSSGR